MTRFISDELPKDHNTEDVVIVENVSDQGFLPKTLIDIDIDGDDSINDNPEAFLAHLPALDADDLALLQELAVAEDEPEDENDLVSHVVDTIDPKTLKKARKPKNYINNADLMVEVHLSREQDQMTNNLVKMLTMLCDRYATRGQFSGYSYIDDMKAYAMYMIVRTWRGFNPDKGSNPFAYFTQCLKNSFIQFLNKERTERDVRDQLLLDAGMNPSYTFSDSDSGGYENDSDY